MAIAGKPQQTHKCSPSPNGPLGDMVCRIMGLPPVQRQQTEQAPEGWARVADDERVRAGFPTPLREVD